MVRELAAMRSWLLISLLGKLCLYPVLLLYREESGGESQLIAGSISLLVVVPSFVSNTLWLILHRGSPEM